MPVGIRRRLTKAAADRKANIPIWVLETAERLTIKGDDARPRRSAQSGMVMPLLAG
jgi:hypothetical protein